MANWIAFLVLIKVALVCGGSPWPESAELEAKKLVARMDEDSLHFETYGHTDSNGNRLAWQCTIPAQDQWGLPGQHNSDGPQGVAYYNWQPEGNFLINATQFPTELSVANAWDTKLVYEYGDSLGIEQKIKGTTVALGPAVNLARVPWNGRNFEYMGEDPFLAARLAEQYIVGLQSNNISGCLKHLAFNDQEYNRMSVNVKLSRRTAMELYYPAFVAAIDAGIGSVMCSYNRINGTYACENYQILEADLRQKFGFKGWVRSDGGATHSTVAAANNGLDQEMPTVGYFGDGLKNAVDSGQVPMSRLRQMVERQVTALIALNMINEPTAPDSAVFNIATSPERVQFARRIVRESTVLLKNDKSFLPWNVKEAGIKLIAVYGDESKYIAADPGASGYSYSDEYTIVTPTQGITNYLQSNSNFRDVKVVYGGKDPSTVNADNLAADADVILVVGGSYATEGQDRKTLAFDSPYDDLISAVAALNPNVVVEVRCSGACLMPWIDSVRAVLYTGFPGQEAGNGVADLLFGLASPSGKLAVSFPMSDTTTWLSSPYGGAWNPTQYPGVTAPGASFPDVNYSEELLVGYRFYDATGYEALFPFGFGLSYTTFAYSDLGVSGTVPNLRVSFKVRNSGAANGAEVTQLYIGFPKECEEPPKLLKGFHKTSVLFPNEYELVTIELNVLSFSIFDVVSDDWVIKPGIYSLYVSSSSRAQDIQLTTAVTIK